MGDIKRTMCYSIKPRDRVYGKGYWCLFFPKKHGLKFWQKHK